MQQYEVSASVSLEDVLDLRPEWSLEACQDFLEVASQHVKESMRQCGLDLIRELSEEA